jgi:hypothetical protein
MQEAPKNIENDKPIIDTTRWINEGSSDMY